MKNICNRKSTCLKMGDIKYVQYLNDYVSNF